MKLKSNILRRTLNLAAAVFFFTIFYSLFAVRPLFAASVWTETTDADFSDGIFNMTITSGTGAAAQLTLSPFGNGADGDVTISATKNINADIITGGRSFADGINYAVSGVWISSITCAAAPNGIVTGDEIILINQQGDATNNGNVGNYEFFRIAGVSGNFLIFTSSIAKIYGATTSNNVLTGQKITAQRVPNWGNVTISGAGTQLTCLAWDGTKGGMVVFRSTGTVSVGSGASVDVRGKGYRGGAAGTGPGGSGTQQDAFQGESYIGTGSRSTSNNYGAGGGGRGNYNTSVSAAGGGGGGYGNNGSIGSQGGIANTPGTGGSTYNNNNLTGLFFGSGGGGGGSDWPASDSGGNGGIGGGILFFAIKTLSVSGTINLNGGNGGNAPGPDSNGGGGGGSGGSIYITASGISDATLITATGGSGGTPNGGGGAGGAGGSGRIRLDYQSLTGTTNPTHFAGTFPSGLDVGRPATYRSNVLNTASADTRVSTVTWNPTLQPALSSMTVSVRASNTSFAAGDATPPWTQITNNTAANLTGQYIQYMSTFTTTNSTTTPRIEDITIFYCVKPNGLAWGNIFITSMTINWTDTTSNPAGTIYTAQISTASDLTGTIFSSQTIKGANGATVSGLSVNTTYYARVIAGPTTGNIAATNLSPAWKATLCSPPASLSFGTPTNTAIVVNWGASSPDNPSDTQYIVQVASWNGFTGTIYSVNRVRSDVTGTVTGLTPNTTYWARVIARNREGTDAATSVGGTKATLANAPTNMTLASPSSSEIQIVWQANGNPTGTKYIAHCSSDNFASIFSSTVTTASASFVSLARNKKYNVRVYAANHDQAASGYLGPNDWRTKPGAFQSKSAQSQPTRTGANAFGFVGDAVWDWEVPVKSGSALTITAYIRYNSEYGGSTTKPKLTISGKGISPTSISATSSAENAWELLTINAGTPSQNATLTLRAEGFSTTPNAKFYVDDINVSQ